MFDLEAHLNQMLKIILQLRDNEELPASMTAMQKRFFETIEPNIRRLQDLVPFTHQSDLPYEVIRYMSTEWRTPITTITGYLALLLMNLDGELTSEQRGKLEQLKPLVDELWVWSNQSFNRNHDEGLGNNDS